MPREKSAGIILFYIEPDKQIKYLLLKHIPDSWDFPKGLVEDGENLEEAAKRECQEETGIKIENLVPGFKETIRFFFRVKFPYQVERGFKMGQTVLKFVTYFLGQSATRDVKISFEHEGYEWLAFEDAFQKLKKHKDSQKVLQKANDLISRKSF